MKNIARMIVGCLILPFILTGLAGPSALAATAKIDTVKLTFSYDEAPKAGEAPGTVTAKSTSREYTVESAEYINDVEQWSLGDKPKVEVILKAADGYRFSYTSSSHFCLSSLLSCLAMVCTPLCIIIVTVLAGLRIHCASRKKMWWQQAPTPRRRRLLMSGCSNSLTEG